LKDSFVDITAYLRIHYIDLCIQLLCLNAVGEKKDTQY